MTRMPSIVGLILLAAVAAGCACRPKPDPAPPPVLELLDRQPGAGSVLASEMYQRLPARWRYSRVDEGGRANGETLMTRSLTDQYGAEVCDSESGTGAEFWRTNESGDIIMPAYIDEAEGTVSLFQPPVVIACRELAAGAERATQCTVRIVDLRNPARLKETGTAVRTIRYVGDQRLRTPSGEFMAQRVEVHFVLDLRLADADEQIVMFIVPGTGLVAEQSVLQVKVLGAFRRTQRRAKVLIADR